MAQADIRKLDDYISAYYEENIDAKLKASKLILDLFQDFNNLKILLDHDSLLPVLSRTLSENHKRNIDLSVYTLSIFYILSNYVQFQELIMENVIGKTVLEVLENQIQRFDLLYSEYIELWRKNQTKDRLIAKSQLKKLNILIWKQDKLFFVCLNILLNISYDPSVEKKMKKAGIIGVLVRCLERNDFHLLLVTLVFLRKLATIGEYKNQMVALNIVNKLDRFFSCESDTLLNLALLVYYNLAFDKPAREAIEKASLIPKLVQLLVNQSYSRMPALKILYLMSTDYTIRYTIAYTNCMQNVINLILVPHPNVGAIQLLSFAINLSTNEQNVEHLQIDDFMKLIEKAVKSEDPTLLKLCKNILRNSKSPQIHTYMVEIIQTRLIKLAITKSKNEEMCLEVLGIMASSRIGKDWTNILLGNSKFPDYLEKIMLNGVTDDEILVQIIMLLANICQEGECCSLLQNLFEALLSLFVSKDYDPQFITQLLYSMYVFMYHGVGIERVFSENQVLLRILELIDDPNERIRQMNDEVLTLLRETENIQLNEDIKERKFQRHNKKWLTETQGMQEWVYEDSPYGYSEEMLDPRMWESEDDYD